MAAILSAKQKEWVAHQQNIAEIEVSYQKISNQINAIESSWNLFQKIAAIFVTPTKIGHLTAQLSHCQDMIQKIETKMSEIEKSPGFTTPKLQTTAPEGKPEPISQKAYSEQVKNPKEKLDSLYNSCNNAKTFAEGEKLFQTYLKEVNKAYPGKVPFEIENKVTKAGDRIDDLKLYEGLEKRLANALNEKYPSPLTHKAIVEATYKELQQKGQQLGLEANPKIMENMSSKLSGINQSISKNNGKSTEMQNQLEDSNTKRMKH